MKISLITEIKEKTGYQLIKTRHISKELEESIRKNCKRWCVTDYYLFKMPDGDEVEKGQLVLGNLWEEINDCAMLHCGFDMVFEVETGSFYKLQMV